MNKEEFKEKYFKNNFYWVNKGNYQELQNIGVALGCLNPNKDNSIIEWHEGFNNLGFRTYDKNGGITVFQKEPFLLYNEIATNYDNMLEDYKKTVNRITDKEYKSLMKVLYPKTK